MNKTSIKNFAIWARNKLIADIQYRAGLMGITANGIKDPLPQSTATMEFYDIGTAEPYAITGNAISQRKRLVEVIRKKEKDSNYATAYKYILEEVAYTWFNRLIAVRFMEVNDYLPSHIRVLSSESGKIEPDLVTTPFDAELNFTSDEKETVLRLKTENKLDELFRLLFIKQCNALNDILPALFEQTNDYTELLLSLSVVDQEGVVYHLIHDIEEDNFNIEKGGQVEIIGWLYQYYISEKHEEVVDPLHGKVVNKEDVPAATQLFTTDWVVRYIIDNSLGRYWLERHPESKLKDSLKFFVSSKTEPLKTVAEEIQPQDLTVFDPCIGSGHFLLYAFEVLMKIYFECGYSDRDAVRLIVDNNLYGIDIDDRAVQLAYFSVMMKARSYDRRFLGRGIQPNVYPVVESNYLSKNTLEYIAEKNTTIHNDIQTLLGVFTDAKEYGSIIQIPKIDFDGIYARFDEIENDISLFKEDALSSYLPLVNVARTLSQKYTVVATNPPYLNKYDAKLKSYVQNHYKDYGGDLFSVFIYRNFDFCKSNGYSGLMTPNVWMFIKSYEKLRHFLLEQKCIVTLVQMAKGAFFKEATVDICSFVLKNAKDNGKGLYFRLEDFKGGMEVQRQKVEEAIANPGCGYFYEATASNFSKIPGSPVAYWVSAVMIAAFAQTKVNDYCQPRQGFATGDNERFIRLWYEINIRQANFEGKNGVENPGKWFPCNKGGEYRKWYGNNLRFVNWKDNGKEMKEFSGSVIRNPSYYFREGITWSTISSAQISMRYSPQGFLFESKGSVCFFKHQEDLPYIMAILNSKVVYAALLILAPTLDFHEGPIGRVPIIDKREYRREVKDNVSHNILSAKSDWDSYETSWDFKHHPLFRSASRLAEAYAAWKDECEQRFQQLKANEEELNRIFIDIYGLQDELTPDVAEKDVTVHRIFDTKDEVPESMQGSSYVRTKRDEIVSLLSYAVGCMFGRYSLDVDGLAYAGGEWDASKYKTFQPDRDGILPITDEEYLQDDIISRLCDWLKVAYGADALEENLDFIADALGGKGDSSREIIRNYFLKDFFKDHCKTYQKRPIYWLFDSGKQDGFKALIYLHRYTPDTIGNIRVDYLHKMQRVYESEIGRMQDMIDHSANAREVAASTKRKEKLQKQLKECRDYDEMIAHLALSRIELDLDDGVKVNYEKIQTAGDGKQYPVLAKI